MRDSEALNEAAQKLKGVVANLQADCVYRAALALETTGRAKDLYDANRAQADEAVSLMLAGKTLQRQFRVMTANAPQKALAILRREEVAVLVTDQRMPGMTGTKLMRSGRQINLNIVCLLLTSTNDNETLHDAVMKS